LLSCFFYFPFDARQCTQPWFSGNSGHIQKQPPSTLNEDHRQSWPPDCNSIDSYTSIAVFPQSSRNPPDSSVIGLSGHHPRYKAGGNNDHGFKGVALVSPKRRLSVGAPRNLEASCSPWTAVKGVHIGPPRRPGHHLGVEVVALGDFGRPGLVEREAQQLSGNPNWSGKRRNWWRELRGKEREQGGTNQSLQFD
jgi:hypothetical protein